MTFLFQLVQKEDAISRFELEKLLRLSSFSKAQVSEILLSVPFVKRAEAVEFTPLNPNISPSDPLDTLMKELFFIGGFLFLLFIFGAIFILGRKNDRQNSQNQQSSQ